MDSLPFRPAFPPLESFPAEIPLKQLYDAKGTGHKNGTKMGSCGIASVVKNLGGLEMGGPWVFDAGELGQIEVPWPFVETSPLFGPAL